MKKKILLVGCGNIGSRHLQSLTKLPYETEITIVEPNKNSQIIAKKRLEEMTFNGSNFVFKWKTSLDKLKPSDLVIVATPSNERVNLLKNLLENGHSTFLIEKMVCQSKKEYQFIQKLIKKSKAKCWVNTSRRYYESYKSIKKIFSKKTNLIVTGGNVGLGSNAIHYIDLFCWFNDTIDIQLNGDFLFEKIFPSKRGNHFSEFAGVIIGKNLKNSSLYLNFSDLKNFPVTVRLFDKENDLFIDETNQKILSYHGNSKITRNFKIDPQSDLTVKMASDILKNNKCDLPTIDESYFTHKELFRIFNNHIEKITNEKKEKCPIT
ncbi:MAG: Gfo/Idh/MocA family oxidoreductase [Nitrosopumilus sp.]|uniref:Gfo/Idh/MocA family oxidoreductase n=1 Tax=Nitrosopumilus sp. TaxID=2024843 RepID=UPI00247B46B5|nr:Gfo/Idh/MocA family oxidoreductase [Nitrosopumilus sp.]MCV0393571.1 Gfo/Idh/MocA family oxidoreductase [Nitrosopumilus sp.]